ncbi:hypothetical protein HG535_0C04810 [Zygotorulaspora mrakii]|uniref:Uncharacterized protein n=1 Tax=Zygotorulaspora mrakii TaxID=42260 RepID=A0A7H9B0W7_ZYGMR|nr:uncharacterized protein HG535_0C04810 [Zygotorulaspora mrakii]QLG72127.1 hypothetical protein HG535_0C04810 [Zygotorulaspora mrakii]
MSLPTSRLSSLYRDFRPSKELNPDGYLANITTWKSYLIEQFLERENNLVFHCGTDFVRKLNREPYGVPQSIDVVINALVREGYLVTVEDFKSGSMYPNEGSAILRWLKVGWSSRNRFDCRQNEDSINYLKEVDLLIRPMMERKSKDIDLRLKKGVLFHATGVADLIYPENEFFEHAGFSTYMEKDDGNYEIMMTYLSLYQNIIIRQNNIVKIVAESMPLKLRSSSKLLTEDDLRVASLKTSLTNVERQIHKVEDEIAQSSRMLEKSLRNKSPKELQKEYLLAKKLSQKYLTRLLNYRNNLRTIKGEINMASTNEMIVRSLDDSKELLKSINESVGSFDRLHDLMDEIKEQKDKTEEINKLLTVDEAGSHYDEEIEIELQKMIKRQDSGIESEISDENKSDLLDKLSHLEITKNKGQDKNSTTPKKAVSNRNSNARQPERLPIADP